MGQSLTSLILGFSLASSWPDAPKTSKKASPVETVCSGSSVRQDATSSTAETPNKYHDTNSKKTHPRPQMSLICPMRSCGSANSGALYAGVYLMGPSSICSWSAVPDVRKDDSPKSASLRVPRLLLPVLKHRILDGLMSPCLPDQLLLESSFLFPKPWILQRASTNPIVCSTTQPANSRFGWGLGFRRQNMLRSLSAHGNTRWYFARYR